MRRAGGICTINVRFKGCSRSGTGPDVRALHLPDVHLPDVHLPDVEDSPSPLTERHPLVGRSSEQKWKNE